MLLSSLCSWFTLPDSAERPIAVEPLLPRASFLLPIRAGPSHFALEDATRDFGLQEYSLNILNEYYSRVFALVDGHDDFSGFYRAHLRGSAEADGEREACPFANPLFFPHCGAVKEERKVWGDTPQSPAHGLRPYEPCLQPS